MGAAAAPMQLLHLCSCSAHHGRCNCMMGVCCTHGRSSSRGPQCQRFAGAPAGRYHGISEHGGRGGGQWPPLGGVVPVAALQLAGLGSSADELWAAPRQSPAPPTGPSRSRRPTGPHAKCACVGASDTPAHPQVSALYDGACGCGGAWRDSLGRAATLGDGRACGTLPAAT